MTLKLYPVGIQTFEEIIKRNLLYVDKTEYVYRMTHGGGKYFFLSRPRRFGKSLLTSTFQSYFEGKKNLFKGLAIERLETEWTEYPVLHFSMATAKHVDVPALKSELNLKLLFYENIYGKGEGEENENQRLMGIIMRAYEQTGKQVVVLIDEYDAPLLDVVHEEENLNGLRQVMRNFYSPLKDCEPYLRFVFLTGITKFSQLSIFSELNNISNVSMQPQYAGICGITKEELQTQMSADIDALGEKLEMTREDVLEDYQQMLFVIFTLLSAYMVDVEVLTSRGRVDMVLRTATHLYLFELKLNKSADAAIRQIDLKEYPKRFALCGLPTVKVGINFDAEKHNITNWKVKE